MRNLGFLICWFVVAGIGNFAFAFQEDISGSGSPRLEWSNRLDFELDSFVSTTSSIKSLQPVVQGGEASAPGLFQVIGSMEVKANLRQLKKLGLDEAEVLVPLPLRYRDQYPLTYNLSVSPAQSLKSFEIFEDQPGNYVAAVVLGQFNQHKKIEVKFDSLVMVSPSDYSGVPKTAPLPESWPDEAKPWLQSTWCVDSDHHRIKAIGTEILEETNDVIEIISRIERRANLIFRAAKGNIENLIAVDALDGRGSCTSRGNLVAALLRASGVPARVLAGYPSWSGPLQTHYIVEAYVPGFGWYPIESTKCTSPWPNHGQINVSIVFPEYESEQTAGYRTGIVGGVPFLSLTEIRNNDNLFYTVGIIPEHRACDHECRFIREFESDELDWEKTAQWSQGRWETWLKSKPEIVDGKIQFGPLTEDVSSESPAALMKDLHIGEVDGM